MIKQLTAFIFLSMYCAFSSAEPVSTTTIVGDQELPQVLFILPWQHVDNKIPTPAPPLEYSREYGVVERSDMQRTLELHVNINPVTE